MGRVIATGEDNHDGIGAGRDETAGDG